MLGKRGLVSVTFRQLTPEQIIRLCVDNRLESIEWGADIHVPPADLANAKRVGEMTRAAGLEVVSYGSYHYLGKDGNPCDIAALLSAADALGAKNLRVWAGYKPSAETDDGLFRRIVEEAQVLAEQCAAHGMTLSFEYHGNTMTDSRQTAVRLMQAVNHPNCYTYWQPVCTLPHEENLAAIRDILPWLSNVHVFQWIPTADSIYPAARPLETGLSLWRDYLSLMQDGRSHNLQMEFVPDASVEIFPQEVRTFLSL